LRQVTLFILSAVFAFSATELHQLIRLPQLVAHYHEHKQEDPSMSLIGFLQLHYTANHPMDNDDNDDNQLPFKTTEAIGHVDFSINIGRLNLNTQPEFAATINQISHPEGNPCHRVYAIFRPPQVSIVI
jgi:hypothetical protein